MGRASSLPPDTPCRCHNIYWNNFNNRMWFGRIGLFPSTVVDFYKQASLRSTVGIWDFAYSVDRTSSFKIQTPEVLHGLWLTTSSGTAPVPGDRSLEPHYHQFSWWLFNVKEVHKGNPKMRTAALGDHGARISIHQTRRQKQQKSILPRPSMHRPVPGTILMYTIAIRTRLTAYV